jgi:hypothetical protein
VLLLQFGDSDSLLCYLVPTFFFFFLFFFFFFLLFFSVHPFIGSNSEYNQSANHPLSSDWIFFPRRANAESERERARVIKDARMHGVRVTTHGNLAVDMIDEDRVMAMIDGSGYGDAVPRGARIEWGLRYTEVLKCRSLVKSRAYILRCAGEA